jgi:hypothetical protein
MLGTLTTQLFVCLFCSRMKIVNKIVSFLICFFHFSYDIDLENRLSQETTVLVENYTVSI